MVNRLKYPAQLCLGIGWGLVAGFVFAADVGSASSVPDPTRPPAEFLQLDQANGGAGGGAGPVSNQNLYSSSGLQAVVLHGQGGKPVAIINGETVRLGAKVGEAKLVSVTESSAVLQGPNGREVLRMTPQIEKKFAVEPSAARSKNRKTSKKLRKNKNQNLNGQAQ